MPINFFESIEEINTNFTSLNNDIGTKIHSFADDFMANLQKIDDDINR